MTNGFNDCKTLGDFEALFPARGLPAGAEVVRAAPSPTGMPHIGTAMQATLNYALAAKSKGIFILRIEDTDRARTLPGAVEAIIDAHRWIDCVPNEGTGFGGNYGPYTQSERINIYQVAANHLLSEGHAYRCFCTEQRLEVMRRNQAANHQPPMYDRHCRNLSADEVSKKLTAGEKHVVRMKIPDGEKITFTDLVRGEITFESATVDDQVLLKSDGFPTYHLAVVVDDHFMRVTTIVRGEEWISSTPKHVLLYRYFGWTMPKLLHTVLLRNAEKRKLSKRSGDTSLTWFQRQGILPVALRNFLTRIMWAHPEGKDVYPYSDFINLLETRHLPSTGPVADMTLLQFINNRYLTEMSAEQRVDGLKTYIEYLLDTNQSGSDTIDPEQEAVETTPQMLQQVGAALAEDRDYAVRIMEVEPGRHHRLTDMIFNSLYFFDTSFVPATAEQLAKQSSPEMAFNIVQEFAAKFAANQALDFQGTVKEIAAAHQLKDKQVFMTLRLALTGKERTPPLPEIMHAMHDKRVTARMAAAMASLK